MGARSDRQLGLSGTEARPHGDHVSNVKNNYLDHYKARYHSEAKDPSWGKKGLL